MIDTVRINFNPARPLRRTFDETRELVRADDRWQYRYERFKVGENWRSGVLLIHKHSGLKIGIVGDSAIFVEASLPRLVHGYNDWLITSQRDIEVGFSLVEGQLEHWALNPNETGWGCGYEFTRIDLVLQFVVPGVPASEVIQSMATMSHPSCRTKKERWSRDGTANAVYHKGRKLEIKAYDKELQVAESQGPGNTVRIEIKLQGSQLQSALGPEAGFFPRDLKFDECYQFYGVTLRKFRPTSCGRGTTSGNCIRSPRGVLLDVFAHASRVNLVMPDGRTPIDHLRSCKASKQTIRTTERDIAGRKLAAIGINWDELFPEQWPPPSLCRSLAEQLQRFSASARIQRRAGDALLG